MYYYLEIDMRTLLNHALIVLITIGSLCVSERANADHFFDYEPSQRYSDRVFTETPPPPGPVRPVAEFEPASHVLIRYPLGIPVSLVAQLSNTATVITIVSSSTVQNQATSTFQSGGVNLANVIFMIAPTNSYWTRDYGPWFIFNGNNELGVVDFPYNRPRPNDDNIPSVFAQAYTYPFYGMNLYQTGGNYMTDGINTAAQTTIAYTENSNLTQQQINQRMQQYMGVTTYFVLPDPNNTYIDHIDCWGKFLAPDKVLIRSVPTSHSQYSQIEQTATFFASQNCAWGYPYKVYRVYTPQNQPYTNSLILNNKVFVPIMNTAHDTAALQVYQQALPSYQIIGVLGSSSAVWESTDALHCRTHEIPDRNMLHISHTPPLGSITYNPQMPYISFEVNIRAHSNAAIIADSTFVSYRINRGQWQRAYLNDVVNDLWISDLIGGWAPGDTLYYFIHAADASGRSANHPLTAASDPHVKIVAADTQAPVIQHVPLPEEMLYTGPIVLSAIVDDNIAVAGVAVVYAVNNDALNSVVMADTGNNVWIGQLDLTLESPGPHVLRYRVEANDIANPPNISWFPAAGEWITTTLNTVSNQDIAIPPLSVELIRHFPNPLRISRNDALRIDYKADSGQPVEISIYNVRGQLVNTVHHQTGYSGMNRIEWNGRDKSGKPSTPGLYLIRFVSGEYSRVIKAMLVE